MIKKELRPIYQQILKEISFPRRRNSSKSVLTTIQEILDERTCDTDLVMSFMSIPNEINLIYLNQYLAKKGRLVLPRVSTDNLQKGIPVLDAYKVNLHDNSLKKSKYGILEPDPETCQKINPKQIKVILVSGLAFDRYNSRLGRGGGYYDWFLSQLSPETIRIGVGFKEQLYDEELPFESHDQLLDHVYLF